MPISDRFTECIAVSSEALRATEQALLQTNALEQSISWIAQALESGLPLLVCGNGGSAADASHIAGELVGRFLRERRALPVISLSADNSILTAWSNDYDYSDVFSRQVDAYGRPGAVLLAISTSGNSPNILHAVKAAKSIGMKTIALTGGNGGRLVDLVDTCICAVSCSTPIIQQVHQCVYHFICDEIDRKFA